MKSKDCPQCYSKDNNEFRQHIFAEDSDERNTEACNNDEIKISIEKLFISFLEFERTYVHFDDLLN